MKRVIEKRKTCKLGDLHNAFDGIACICEFTMKSFSNLSKLSKIPSEIINEEFLRLKLYKDNERRLLRPRKRCLVNCRTRQF